METDESVYRLINYTVFGHPKMQRSSSKSVDLSVESIESYQHVDKIRIFCN